MTGIPWEELPGPRWSGKHINPGVHPHGWTWTGMNRLSETRPKRPRPAPGATARDELVGAQITAIRAARTAHTATGGHDTKGTE